MFRMGRAKLMVIIVESCISPGAGRFFWQREKRTAAYFLSLWGKGYQASSPDLLGFGSRFRKDALFY
jgi:hypothetical protein